jgi:CRP/FNR family transcriptional regulator
LVNNDWYLRQIDVFEGLDESQFESLFIPRTYAKKDVVYSPDDMSDRIYYVKEGKVKLSKFSPDGKEIILGIYQTGEVFGEMVIYHSGQRESYAIAIEESEIWMLRKTHLEKLIIQIPELAERLMTIIAQRRYEVEQRLEDVVFKTVDERLASLILVLAKKFGENIGKATRINLKLIHYDLANLIGSTRETTTAVLNQFKRKKLIAIQDKMIIILDEKGLEELIGKE